MRKSILFLTGLALWMIACVPECYESRTFHASSNRCFTCIKWNIQANVEEENVQLIFLEKYNPPKEATFVDIVTVLVHGKLRLPVVFEEYDDGYLDAFSDCYFFVSKDGNTLTLLTIGEIPLDVALDIRVLSDNSFKIRLKDEDDAEWITFTK